jgi:hypothetical protein
MLLLSWLLCYIVLSGLFEYLPKLATDILDNFAVLFVVGFYIISSSALSTEGDMWNVKFGFLEAFVIPNVISICAMFALFGLSYKNLDMKVTIYLSVGMGLMIIAVIIWAATEPYCDNLRLANGKSSSPNPFTRVSHGLWHILFSFGSYYFIQCALYAQNMSRLNYVKFATHDNCFVKAVFYILPVVTYDAEKNMRRIAELYNSHSSVV